MPARLSFNAKLAVKLLPEVMRYLSCEMIDDFTEFVHRFTQYAHFVFQFVYALCQFAVAVEACHCTGSMRKDRANVKTEGPVSAWQADAALVCFLLL